MWSRRASNSFRGLPIARAALTFASARHANQYREIDHAPFIAHPIEVGSLLHADGQPDEVIAAGLLHDVLEKTGTTRAELQRRFGARVAGLVESVSDDPSIDDYGSRKRELRDRVAHAGSDTVAIFAADKISKVRELTLLPTSRLDETTTRAKLAHYQASLEMLRGVAGNSALVDLLDAELDRLSHEPVTGTRAEGAITAIRREAEQAASSHNLTPFVCAGRGAASEAVTSVGTTRSARQASGYAPRSAGTSRRELLVGHPEPCPREHLLAIEVALTATGVFTSRSPDGGSCAGPPAVAASALSGRDSGQRMVIYAIDCPRPMNSERTNIFMLRSG